MSEVTSGDVITALLFQAGGGLILGFAAGYAVKKMVKIAILILGLLTVGLLILSYYGIISVNWDKLALIVERVISGAQATTASMQAFILASIPFAGAFTAGFIIGFKYG
ncbi:MAG: FUN14 domain-containing protein [Thermoprotei archaeon]|nr:FUN14 domain-containing protein [Thermoprotei archaeon]